MDAKLWITIDQQMDVIGHDFYFFNENATLRTHFLNNLFQALVNAVDQNLTAIFGTPDYMVVRDVRNIVVRPYLFHTKHYIAISYLLLSTPTQALK